MIEERLEHQGPDRQAKTLDRLFALTPEICVMLNDIYYLRQKLSNIPGLRSSSSLALNSPISESSSSPSSLAPLVSPMSALSLADSADLPLALHSILQDACNQISSMVCAQKDLLHDSHC